MPKLHLTDRFIKNVIHDKRVEYYDQHLIEGNTLKREGANGLILRVNPTSKLFMFRYYRNGNTKRVTIGHYPELSLSDARSKARELSEMSSDGHDPARERQKRKTEAPITLGQYAVRFKRDYIARRLKPSTQKDYTSRLNRILDTRSLASLPMKDITNNHIREFLKEEVMLRPTNANRIHSVLSKLFNEAVEDRVITDNPIKGMKKLAVERERDVVYSEDQIRLIWKSMEDNYPTLEYCLKMLLVTGQREGETSRMKWANIDLSARVWRIPAGETKNSTPHEVPLSEMAVGILNRMKEMFPDSALVFPSLNDQERPIPDFRTGAKRIRKALGSDEFHVHDLRHIVGGNMTELGIDLVVIGEVLNHKGLAGEYMITKRYAKINYLPRKREALDIWGGRLTTIITNLKSVKVG
ncbi:MAG: tyrosine-type recombinase/integrase [Bacteroidetes bacterium]|nr:tyrosine-type recombinase/integrase [Bacteroidota bacterium]